MIVGVTYVSFGLALLAICAGAVIQGSIGFGFGHVAVPAIAIIEPTVLPAAVLLLALPMTWTMAVRERRDIDLPGFGWIIAGRLTGTAAGAALLVAASESSVSLLFGLVILAAVAISVAAPTIPARGSTRLAAGLASGVFATAAGIGGPPLALLYQERSGAVLRSTLALTFAIGTVLSLGALFVAGEFHGRHLSFALALAPAMLLGLWGSRFTARRLDKGWLQPAVLTFAGVTGAIAIIRGLPI